MISIDKTTTASFDVDAQKGFTPLCPDELPVPGGDEIVAALNQQATFARYRVGSKDAHCPHAIWLTRADAPMLTPVTGEHVDVRWPLHCVPGTRGFELLDGLPHPSQYDFFVYKGVEPDMHPYGACYHTLHETQSTGVIEFLRAREIQTVIVGGLATEHCVKNTALQLLAAQFRVIVHTKACRGISAPAVAEALALLKDQGAYIAPTLDAL